MADQDFFGCGCYVRVDKATRLDNGDEESEVEMKGWSNGYPGRSCTYGLDESKVKMVNFNVLGYCVLSGHDESLSELSQGVLLVYLCFDVI